MNALLVADDIPADVHLIPATRASVGFVASSGNLLLPGERLPTLGQLQALAELARHGSFKDAAYCLGATHGTTRNQAYFGFHRLGVTTSTEAFGVMGWLTVPRALLGCE